MYIKYAICGYLTIAAEKAANKIFTKYYRSQSFNSDIFFLNKLFSLVKDYNSNSRE